MIYELKVLCYLCTPLDFNASRRVLASVGGRMAPQPRACEELLTGLGHGYNLSDVLKTR